MNAIDVFAEARPDVDVDDEVLASVAADLFGGTTRGRRTGWRVLGVGAAVIALVAGLAFVVGRPGRTVPADNVPPAGADGVEPLAMLPADVTPWTAIGGVSRPIDDPVLWGSAVIARSDGNGGYDSPVTVRRGPSDSILFRVGGFESAATSETVGLTDDRRGELVTDPAGGELFVQFELGDGTAVTVSTRYREPLSGERARLFQIAANVAFPDGTDAVFGSLPDGFEIVAPWKVDGVRTVRWAAFEAGDRADWYTVNVVPDPDPVFALRAMADDVVPVRLRGTTGYLSTRRFVGRDDVQALTVMWQEQPGQWVLIDTGGPSFSQPDLFAFAESLRVVSAAEWDRVVEPIDDAAEVPATTAPVIPADGEPVRLLPRETSGYEFDGEVLSLGPFGDADYLAVGRPDGGGGYVDSVWIARGDRDEIWVSEPEWEGEGTFTEIDLDSRAGELVSDRSGTGRIVQFEVGDGTAVAVTAVGSAGMGRDDLVSIALGLDLDGGGLGFASPPDGHEVVASGRFGIAPEPRRTLNVWRDGEQFAGLSVTVTANPGFPFLDMGDAIEPVAIRGRAGWVTTSVWQTDDGPWERSSLRWEEQPGQWATLEEMGPVALGELTAFAESLRVVTADEWDRVVGSTDVPVVDVPASTAPAGPAAPAGRVLVANASQVPGLASQYSSALAGSGVDVLDPVNASYDGGVPARTVIFARPDAYELADWVQDGVGVELIHPFDDIARFSWEVPGDLGTVDVLVVLGLDKTPPAVAAGRPMVFGDSVIMSAVDVLERRNYIVNAEVSRPFDSLVFDVLTVLTALHPEVLVLHVGNNGPIGRRELEDLLEWTADVPNVILVNAHGDRDWVAPNNVLLDEVDEPEDNLILMNWDALAEQCPGECFAPDGIHLTDAGAQYFADRLADITGF